MRTIDLLKTYFDDLNGKMATIHVIKVRVGKSESQLYRCLFKLMGEGYISKFRMKSSKRVYYAKK